MRRTLVTLTLTIVLLLFASSVASANIPIYVQEWVTVYSEDGYTIDAPDVPRGAVVWFARVYGDYDPPLYRDFGGYAICSDEGYDGYTCQPICEWGWCAWGMNPDDNDAKITSEYGDLLKATFYLEGWEPETLKVFLPAIIK